MLENFKTNKTKTNKIIKTIYKKSKLSKSKTIKQKKPVQQPTIKEDIMTNTMTMDDLDIDVAPYEIEKGADYMTEEQLEHFRKILLRWKHPNAFNQIFI